MDGPLPTASPAANRAKRRVIAAMLIATFMSAAEVTVISTAMPTIVSRLGGFDLFTWAFGVYLLGQAITTPIYGRLADLYGRRTVYIASTALFLLGSLACGLAWSMPSLIVFRAIQGLGGGGLVPLATTIISDVCTQAERPRVLGYVSGIWGVAAIAGPLIGSVCVGTIGWPWVFWLNLPIGALTLALVMRYFVEPPRVRLPGNIDLAGSALLALGAGCGMAALIQWQALTTVHLAMLWAICCVCLFGFALIERRAATPMLAAYLMRKPVILAANASALICGALVIELTAFIPPVVQGVFGLGALAAGLVLGVMTVSWSTTSMGLGRFLVRLPLWQVALGGSVALVAGSALLLSAHSLPMMLVACVPLGCGLGGTNLTLTVALQNAVGTTDRGRATSLYYFSRLLGQAIGSAALGGVLNAGLASGGPNTHEALQELMDAAGRAALPPAELARLVPVLGNALHTVFICGLLIAALSVPVALIIPRQRAQPG